MTSACKHIRGDGTTLHTVFTAQIDGKHRLWFVYCHVCDRKTDLVMTPDEAIERATVEWWASPYRTPSFFMEREVRDD